MATNDPIDQATAYMLSDLVITRTNAAMSQVPNQVSAIVRSEVRIHLMNIERQYAALFEKMNAEIKRLESARLAYERELKSIRSSRSFVNISDGY